MTVLESIELFHNEMANEIFATPASPELKEELIFALNNVKKLVIETYESEKKAKS